MQPHVAGIYAITHIASGLQYIGRSKDIPVRWRAHRWELSRGQHHSPYLQRKWDKDGPDAFTFAILELVPDVARLRDREQHYLDARFAAKGSTEFNVQPTADGPRETSPSAATRQKWSEQRKGKPWTPARRESFKGLSPAQQEHAKQLGQWMRDNAYSPEVYAQLTKPTPARLAHIYRLVELQTGRPHTSEWNANITKSLRERWDRLEAEGKLSMHPKAVASRRRKRAKREAAQRALEALLVPVQLPLFPD